MNAPEKLPVLAEPREKLIAAMTAQLYPGAQPESVALVLDNCIAQNLDPFTKPFHIVPMQVKRKKPKGGYEYVWVDQVFPGIELYRIKAARTGAYAGMDEATFGPVIKEELGGEDKTEWDEGSGRRVSKGKWPVRTVYYTEWCQIVVYRIVMGIRCAFPSGRVWWKETYATAGKETSLPNSMWERRVNGQIEKCAEALALRRAFPEIGGNPTYEEMAGRVIDVEGYEVETERTPTQDRMPRAKAPADAAPAVPPGAGATPPPAGTTDAPAAPPADATYHETPAAPAAVTPAPDTQAPPAAAAAEPAQAAPQSAAPSGPPISVGQVKFLQRKLADRKRDEAEVCREYGVAALDNMTQAQFEQLKAALV